MLEPQKNHPVYRSEQVLVWAVFEAIPWRESLLAASPDQRNNVFSDGFGLKWATVPQKKRIAAQCQKTLQ